MMKQRALTFFMVVGVFAAGLVSFANAGVIAQAPAKPAKQAQTWSVWGGEVGIRWNRDFAKDLGISIAPATGASVEPDWRGRELFTVRRSGSLEFRVESGHFRGFENGSLQVEGGYRLQLANGSIDLTNFRLQPDASYPLRLDLVSADGSTWFYADNLMYELTDSGTRFAIREMDLRIGPELAARLGQPEAANLAIADMKVISDVQRRGVIQAPAGSCNTDNGQNCNWTGTPAPNGGTYEADLFMSSFNPQYSRCQGCSGPNGDGKVVFTPSSSLKNNVNAGSIETTIPGQGGAGQSTAVWAADIPWFTKFTGPNFPYGNDQHPFLIWNMYRINADGAIEQIGRSGVKHAFVTVNAGSDCPYPYSHVLGRSCEDTYGTGNNDSNSDLGPRSEIVAATNQWGRCGSIYDPDCDGNQNNSGNGNYDQRLIVDESKLDASNNPGATWLFESWYLAREDINIYNSMGTVGTTQHWNGSFWGINSSNYTLGPAIDRWVDPTNPGVNAMNTELAVPEGHTKVAVKVTDLGNGTWRYNYAVMNLDYARAVTEGSEPNLRVDSNQGFDSFSVSVPAGVHILSPAANVGGSNPNANWRAQVANGHVTWSTDMSIPGYTDSGHPQVTELPTLDWGSLYSFSFIADAPPATGNGTLHVAETGSPSSYSMASLVPSAAGSALRTH